LRNRSRPLSAREHELDRRVRIGRGVAVERGGADVHRGAEHFAATQLLAQDKLVRRAEHRANRRDAVRYIEEEDVLADLLVIRVAAADYVRVHLSEAGHEVLPPSIDARGSRGDRRARRGAQCDDAVVPHDDSLVLERAIAIERNDCDIHECGHRTGGAIRLRTSG
jgi:hypothetical protein